MPKSKDEWTKFIRKLLARKRSDRKYTIPRDYIHAVAESIHTANPTLGIIENTVEDVYSVAFGRGYQRKESDIRYFKEKRDKTILYDWNRIKTALDDEINSKKS